jgi:hypothetical protein
MVVGINRFTMGDGVDDVDEKTLEGEGGIRGVTVAVGAEWLKELGAPFYDCRSGTPKVVALAIDSFAEWAVSWVASPMGFVFLRGQYLMKKLEVENFCSTSIAGGRTEKI